MSSITNILMHYIYELYPQDIYGAKAIASGVFSKSALTIASLPDTCEIIYALAFAQSPNLQTLILPNSIKCIYPNAFSGCTALNNIILNIPEDCLVFDKAFDNVPYINNATTNVLSTNGKVLLLGKTTTIPDTVTNLAGGVGSSFIVNSHLNYPDQIKIIVGSTTGSPTKMTIGSSTHYLGLEAIPTTVTTLICRQPADMRIQLPPGGKEEGLTYNKDARNMAIYTDNADIKNYNWSADNVTATFYPLSQAPV